LTTRTLWFQTIGRINPFNLVGAFWVKFYGGPVNPVDNSLQNQNKKQAPFAFLPQ
jgi:hypothetical protein